MSEIADGIWAWLPRAPWSNPAHRLNESIAEELLLPEILIRFWKKYPSAGQMIRRNVGATRGYNRVSGGQGSGTARFVAQPRMG
jgi:hypothetical protein